MPKFKIALAALLAVLLVVVIIQNTAAVETRLLFVTVTMPRAVLLFVSVLVGFVVGLLTAFSLSRKQGGAK